MSRAIFSSMSVAGPTKLLEDCHDGPGPLLFASSDIEEARSMVGRVLQPHSLRMTGSGARLDARMNFISLGEISFSRLRYGSTVEIDPGSLRDFFLVQMPLTGTASIQSGKERVDSCTKLGTVLSPGNDTQMTWSANSDQLMLRISKSSLERALVGQLGHPLERRLQFNLEFRWCDNRLWQCLIGYLIECAAQCYQLEEHKLVVKQIEQLAVSTLLASHRHNYSDTPPPRRATILPRHIRRAKEYVMAHAHEPISSEQLATMAGVSLRGLYAGFKEYMGVSPMHYLRDVRMARVRNELLSGEAGNVAGVALRWGFAHLGRFSKDYRLRYGETPSQTLRRG